VSDMIDGVPNKPKTKGKSVRVPDELWQEAMELARENGETNSDIVREAWRSTARAMAGAAGRHPAHL
jgi:predicted DNA-binding protein